MQRIFKNENVKYFSMFSGIGGFELGIQQAYEEVLDTTNRKKNRGGETTSENGSSERHSQSESSNAEGGRSSQHDNSNGEDGQEYPTCVGYSEIDKYAIQIYEKHFKHKNYGDATKINASELPDFDLLVGGFPCQAFSIAGKRKGFNDTRGTLFFDIARILKEKQPRLFVLENVKGLLSHDNGRTFKTIISTLTELRYDLQWQVLNSKNFGVPQNRERVFIVGHLRGTPRPKVFPFTTDGKKTNELQGYVANTLTARYEGAQATGTYIANTISTGKTHTVGTYIGESKLNAQKINVLKNSYYDTDRLYATLSNILEQLKKDGLKITQKGMDTLLKSHDIKIRRLTPTEYCRLQGFPDNWVDEISDTQKYRCLGNAVTVNVIEAIMKSLPVLEVDK
jgi:DNA (cytosine-5)-methyltransferase 1